MFIYSEKKKKNVIEAIEIVVQQPELEESALFDSPFFFNFCARDLFSYVHKRCR